MGADEQGGAEQGGGLDLEARWALVAPHREHLMAIAQRRCPSLQDAEDCVHEAMVRAVAYPGLDPVRAAALLTSIIMRLSIDLARRRGAELRGRPRLALLPDQVAPPDEAVVDHGEAHWLLEQVERLPERERQVFERRVAGLSAPETAAHLRLSYKSVESAFTRARARMRMWAAMSGLLAGSLLRRARQRPAVLTAVLVASAGCLLAATPARQGIGGHGSATNHREGAPPLGAGGSGVAAPGVVSRVAQMWSEARQGGGAVARSSTGSAPTEGSEPPQTIVVKTPTVGNGRTGTLRGTITIDPHDDVVGNSQRLAQNMSTDPEGTLGLR